MLQGILKFIGSNGASCSDSLRVWQTQSVSERTRGLLGRQPLNDFEGLWITPCNSIHSFGMRYPLDLVYVDRRLKVRSLRRNVKPGRLSFDLLAKSVIEMKAGMIDRVGLCRGDQLQWSQDA